MSGQHFSINLCFLLWQKKVNREEWVPSLAKWMECDKFRVQEILGGDSPSKQELNSLMSTQNYDPDFVQELQFSNLLENKQTLETQDPNGFKIFSENVSFLLESLSDSENSKASKISKALDISITTFHRWRKKEQSPTGEKLERLKKYFRLLDDLDLVTNPIFLSLKPIGAIQQRKWLIERISKMDAKQVQELFPALEKILRDE